MRRVVLVLLSIALTSGCGGDDIPTLTADDEGTTVHLEVGEPIDVALKANPTTGFGWTVAAESTRCLRLVGEPGFVPLSDLIGAGGVTSLEFEAVEPGEGDLVLVYRRPWEEAPPLDRFTVKVVVSG